MDLRAQYETALLKLKKATEQPETGTMESLNYWLSLVSVADSQLGTSGVCERLKAFCVANPGLNRWVDLGTPKQSLSAPLFVMVNFAGAGEKKEKERWMPMIVYKLGVEDNGKRLKKTPSKKDDPGPHFVYVPGIDFYGIGDASNLSVWLKSTTSLSDLSNDPHIRKQRQQPKNWRLINPEDGSTKPLFDVIGATVNTWLEKVAFPPEMQRSGPPLLVPQLKTSTDKRKSKPVLEMTSTAPPVDKEVSAPVGTPGTKRASGEAAKKNPPKRQKAGVDQEPKRKRRTKEEIALAKTMADFACSAPPDPSQLGQLDIDPALWAAMDMEPPLRPNNQVLLELPLEFLNCE